jgi:hypothetical protein
MQLNVCEFRQVRPYCAHCRYMCTAKTYDVLNVKNA